MIKSLAKLGIKSIEEAILFAPKSYTNTFLLQKLEHGISGALRVRIDSRLSSHKILRFSASMLDFDEVLEIDIFNAKPYHSMLFSTNKELFILGKLEVSNGIYKIYNPKIIKNINQIVMNFPTTKMQSKNLNEIFRELITKEALSSLGLDSTYIEALYSIFHPESDDEFLRGFQKNGGFFGIYLEALKFAEIFFYIKNLKHKKTSFEATARLNSPYHSFINSLPFPLTKGQSEALEFLAKKLDSSIATRCVVMGDVGCGKTIVILSCVIMAYPKKSVLLAPTTILASQLYEEAKRLLPSHIRTSLAIKDSIPSECDFLIGTHTLLFRELNEFDLFMTDEQHRFGTNQRLRIEKMLEIEGKKPHNIQFSATPIPRTMAMIESNLIDFCFIRDLPFKKDIDSRIITKSEFKELLEHIKSEIRDNKQVAIIYPLVEKSESISYQSIEEGLPFWQKHFSEGLFYTHGKDKDKEEVIESFKDRGKLLIATTLFEVGISLPRLSSIIIVGAERLGFASLHQLRGRVSRNGLKGYCFLYTNKADSARLRDFIDTTNGFEIAELDLKYRNSGDILRGIRQSGEPFKYFDMYEDRILVERANLKLKERV